AEMTQATDGGWTPPDPDLLALAVECDDVVYSSAPRPRTSPTGSPRYSATPGSRDSGVPIPVMGGGQPRPTIMYWPVVKVLTTSTHSH
ncbi:hypothetical protein SAMN04488548_10726, partial [Gordonia westfalica]